MNEKTSEAGRVLSAKNEGVLRHALKVLQEMLGAGDKSAANSTANTAAKKAEKKASSESDASATSETARLPMLPGEAHPVMEAFSYSDIASLLNTALKAKYPRAYAHVQDLFPDTVIYSIYDCDDTRRLYEAPYAIADDGVVTLGDEAEVRSRTVYEPVNQASDMSETSETSETVFGTGDESHGEIEVASDCIPLREAAVGDDGTVKIKLIGEGWGSTGYYPRAVLERDIPATFPAGTKMYLNHPPRSQELDQPERRIEEVAAMLKTAPVWENGAKGPGMYAEAQVREPFRSVIDDLAPVIGPSIYCLGKAKVGEAEGRRGKIMTQLYPGTLRRSVDFVTEPGAGGAVVEAVAEAVREAAKTSPPSSTPIIANPTSATSKTPSQEDAMTEQEATTLRDENARLKESNEQLNGKVVTLETTVSRLSESQNVEAARRVAAPLISASRLPARTQERLLESATRELPTKEDGALDAEKLREAVTQLVEGETTYAREAYGFGNGQVRGFGAAGFAPSAATSTAAGNAVAENKDAKEPTSDERLIETFRARGMTDEQARSAVNGRSR